jgi:hypothetical protein
MRRGTPEICDRAEGKRGCGRMDVRFDGRPGPLDGKHFRGCPGGALEVEAYRPQPRARSTREQV